MATDPTPAATTPEAVSTPDPTAALPDVVATAIGADTTPAATGADTVPAASGQDSVPPGTDTTPGTETTPASTGEETTASSPGEDSVTPIDPASYQLELPEGFTTDDALLASYRDQAAAAGLTQEQFAQFADIGVKMVQGSLDAQATSYNQLQETWIGEIRAMPEFNSQPKLEAALQNIGRLVDDYGTPKVREELNATGAGNAPALFSMLHKLSQSLGEAKPLQPGNPAATRKHRPMHEVLYAKPGTQQ